MMRNIFGTGKLFFLYLGVGRIMLSMVTYLFYSIQKFDKKKCYETNNIY